MLALGLAYGLLEEGLALGSLTSTTLYPVANWAPRLLGSTPRDSAVHLIVVGALAAALVALGLLRHPAVLRDRPIPRPRSLVVIGAVSVAGCFALLMQLPGAEHSAYLPDRLAWLAPVSALILLATGSAICRRWSTNTRWSPVHIAALIAGALPAHSLLGLIVFPLGTLDRVALAIIMAAEVAVGVWLVRRTTVVH